jgi:hypothetical protein
MKKMIAIALSISAAVGAVAVTAPASAAQGCGGGFHRGPAGRCIRNGRPVVVRERWVVGRHYPGRGYYYNNGWYQQRYRYHNGWRYR